MNSGAQRRGGRPSWRSLRTDPDYVADWRANVGPAVHEVPPFPFRRQTEADLKAARWSLLAWEDPHCPGRASPFWADASTVEAVVVPAGDADGHALLHVARRTGARFHGLRLRDGTLIVKFVRVPCAIAAFMSRVFNDGALELPSIHSEGIAAIAVIVDALGSLPGAPGVESRGELREIVAEIRPDFG